MYLLQGRQLAQYGRMHACTMQSSVAAAAALDCIVQACILKFALVQMRVQGAHRPTLPYISVA
jgi:hypothetical protein